MTLSWLPLQRPHFQTLGIGTWIYLIGWHSSTHRCDSFKIGKETHYFSASNPTVSFISMRINLQLWCWPTRSGPWPPLWLHPSHSWLTFSTPAILTSVFFLKDVKNIASWVLWSCFFCLALSSPTCLPDPQIHFVDECFLSISAKNWVSSWIHPQNIERP